jgi:hypothetical protein
MSDSLNIIEATSDYVRLEGLKALACTLAEEIVDARDREDQKLIPGLAREYRATMAEIDAIEGGDDGDDEIASIIIRNRQSASH